MKKRILSFLANILFLSTLAAQGKEGNTWVLGYPPVPGFEKPYYGGTIVKFNDAGGVDTSRFVTIRSMESPSSICDNMGNLLFYSNGCDIINRNHLIMSNGENINAIAGNLYNQYCLNEPYIYGELQEMLILPYPKHQGSYAVIHMSYPTPWQTVSQIQHSTVDMTLDSGLGAVVEKSDILFDALTTNGYLTSVRHGNGIDWWITAPEWHQTRKIVFLLDSLGLHGPDIQEGAGILTGTGGYGQAVFSPDGTKYAEICFFQGQILDFDRCTGKFSNPRVIDADFFEFNDCAGAAFSPNSQYLYVSICDSIYQYDLSVSDFNKTRKTIAKFDGINDSNGLRDPRFYTMLLAPNDKIYLNTPGCTKALHVINNPDERGMACGFQKWGLELPTLHSSGQLPNLPNFKLGARPCHSAACDTLPQTDAFTLFPNPSTDYIVISNKNASLSGALAFQLYDALGRLLIEQTLDCLPNRIELKDLPAAEYFYRIFTAEGERLSSGTLVKLNR